MAHKKTKKTNQYQTDKERLAKLINQKKANNKRMFNLLGIGHLYPLLNEYGELALTKVRISASQIEAPQSCNNSHGKEALAYFKELFSTFEKNTEVTLLSGSKISIREFRTTFSSIFLYFLIPSVDVGQHTEKIKKEINDLFLKYVDTWQGVNKLSNEFFDDVCTHISSLKHGIYYPIEKSREKRVSSFYDNHSIVPLFSFNVEKPARRIVEIEGKRREVYQMGFPVYNKGVRWTTITSEQLGLDSKQTYQCFIQQHAIVRLVERIGIFSESVTVFQACLSIENGKVLLVPGSKSYYIEFKILDIKLGYLIAALVEDILVVKTFIFITQSSSPEGRRMDAISGMKRYDKDYIGLGTLKGFLSEDIIHNPKMELLLEKAGCSDLLKAYEVFSRKVNIKGTMSTGKIAIQFLEKSWGNKDLNSIETYSSDHLAIIPVLHQEQEPEPTVVPPQNIEQEDTAVETQSEETTCSSNANEEQKITWKRTAILAGLLIVLFFLRLTFYLFNMLKRLWQCKVKQHLQK